MPVITRHASSPPLQPVGLSAGIRGGLLGALFFVTAVLVATTVGLWGWALDRNADGDLLLMGTITLLGVCALALGSIATLVFVRRPHALSRPDAPGPQAAQAARQGPAGQDVPAQGLDASESASSIRPRPAAGCCASMPTWGADAARPHPAVAGHADASVGHADLRRRAEGMTSASRRLSNEAEELSACSLDLSTLAHGALRRSSDADDAVRAANLDVASALLEAARESGTNRAVLQGIESCLIHARVTRQLLGEFLALASRPDVSPGTDARAETSSAWQDDAPELAHLAADCLQAADTMARLAAESRGHIQAAEAASSTRMQSMQSLAGSLQDLSAASAALIRMNQSQVKYGDTIAQLASQLALGAVCLNDELQQAFRAE